MKFSRQSATPAVGPLPVALLVTLLFLGAPASGGSHDIPADVTVRVWVKAEDGTLRVLIRAPLSAMRDVRFPRRGSGFLDLGRLSSSLEKATRLWLADYLGAYEDGAHLGAGRIAATRVSLPSDRSFRSGWAEALAHVTAPGLSEDVDLHWKQASLDALIEYPVDSAASRFSLEPRFAHLGMDTETHLRYAQADGTVRRLHFAGNPGRIRLDPRWYEVTGRFVVSGLRTLGSGTEHLLLLLVLVVPFRRTRQIGSLGASFLVGAALALAGFGVGLRPEVIWLPALTGTLVAASVLYVSVVNVLGASLRSRWVACFVFGLIHGVALAEPLRGEMQFAGSHEVAALAAYGGGSFAMAALILAGAALLIESLVRWHGSERIIATVISAFVGHQAWHWFTARGGEFLQYEFQAPELGLVLLTGLTRGAMVVVVVLGTGWLLYELLARLGLPPARRQSTPRPADRSGAADTER